MRENARKPRNCTVQSPSPSAGPADRASPPGPAMPCATGPLTVSIVSHGQASLVDALVRQLAGSTRPGLIGRVVITVNIPEPVPAAWRQPGPWPIEIRENPTPQGFAANHNRALAGVTEGLVAILNPDLQLEGDPLAALAEAAAEPGVGLVVPWVFEAPDRPADAARDLISPASILARTVLRRRRPSQRPAWYAGMCLVLPVAAWRAVGGFDERFRMYCEDFDLCARLRLAGFTLRRVDAARVIHPARRSSHRAWQPLVWHLASLWKVWRSPAYHAYRRLLRDESRGGSGERACAHPAG